VLGMTTSQRIHGAAAAGGVPAWSRRCLGLVGGLLAPRPTS
jgi:hypothetical protein